MLKKKKKKIQKPNSDVPWRCVICSFDPGKNWGASIWFDGRLLLDDRLHGFIWVAGTCYKDKIETVVQSAYHLATNTERPLIFVIEHNYLQGKAGITIQRRIGAIEYCIDKYKDSHRIGPRRWKAKTLFLYPAMWHKGIFGMTKKPEGAPRDFWKEKSLEEVKKIRKGIINHNVSDAILIGKFSTCWWEVGKLPGVVPIAT